MKVIAILSVLHTAAVFAQAKPYKIVILTDTEAVTRAGEFRTYLMMKPPYNKMGSHLSIDIVTMTKEEMNCSHSIPASPRIITCDNKKLSSKQASLGANIALAFTSNGSGGSGGSIPVASRDYPIQTMFHEMLHAYGLDDEYAYSTSEQTVYCTDPGASKNMAYFQDIPPYTGDSMARNKHASQIPWYGKIPVAKLIVSGSNLGSGAERVRAGSQTPGLYRGGSCDSAKLPGWRPYYNSIMRGFDDDTIYPIYEEIIVKNIESSMGRKLNLPPPEKDCPEQSPEIEGLKNFGNTIQDAAGRIRPSHNHHHD